MGVEIDKRLARRLVVIVSVALVVAGVPAAWGETTSTDVTNTPPTILAVELPSGTTDLSLTPTAGGTTTTTVTIEVEDLNGCDNLKDVRPQVNATDGSTHVGPANLLMNWDSCSAGVATYTWDFDMQYYDDPALSTDHYKVYVVAEDDDGATTNNVVDLTGLLKFNYQELTALNLNRTTLDFGSNVNPGTTAGSVQLGVDNHGNVQIDTDLSGTQLDHSTESASIPVSNVNYNLTDDDSSASSLSGTSTTVSSFDLAKGSGSSKTLYWWLDVPDGSTQWIPSGTYEGTVTVSAVKG